ncbi:MAG: hypothetical protein ACR2QK_12875 [Acidimicrobiales bacterium]
MAATDRGDGPIGLLVAASVFVLGLTSLVYAGLGYHANQLVTSAAQQGAAVAARLGGTPEDGVATADEMLARWAGPLVDRRSTTATVVREPDGRGRVVITIEADVVAPLGAWPVEVSGSAPIEEFVHQRAADAGSRSG